MSNIDVSFLCVQPIHIENSLYIKMLKKKSSLKHQPIVKKQTVLWLKKYNKFNDAYRTLQEVDLDDMTVDYIKRDLGNERYFPLNNKGDNINLSSYLDSENTTYRLYYDTRFLYFVLVYDIHFSFPKKILLNFLDYKGIHNNEENKDFYNVIRNLVTKEVDSSILGSWGRYIQTDVIQKIQKYISVNLKIKTLDEDIVIRDNTCNISCFIYDENFESDELVQKFSELNTYAERVTASVEMKGFYENKVFYSFNGRFHTIYVKNKQDKYRFQPLQFHIQYVWFLLRRYNKLMNEINLELMQKDSLKSLQEYAKIIHTMINKIELLSLHDNNFKHTIEIDYKTIYSDNEQRWSMLELLSSSRQYINFFKDYLDRLFSQKNELFQKKQNYILLFISLIQLVALISVWTDYLSILNKNNLTIDGRVLSIFSNTDNLLSFNVYLPVILFSTTGVLLAWLFIRKK